MITEFENPFSDYGTIVYGERFIGRKESLLAIESRVLRPKEPGNLAIIGDSRIGKSSLVYHAIDSKRNKLISKQFIPIWINLSSYDNPSTFFHSLVDITFDELIELNLVTGAIQSAAERALADKLSWSEGYGRIQRFFEKIRKEGLKIIFIIDEFDHARHLFRDEISAFQGLRELAYRPEWKVSYLIISRRTIREIELQTRSISTFDGIFQKYYLGMFDELDIEEYFRRFASANITIDEHTKNQFKFYCDGHPYLLEMLGYEVFELFRNEKTLDIDRAAQRSLQSFLDQYNRMIELLREEDRFDKLLQVTVGPHINVRWTEVEELLRFGFIKESKKGFYRAFSEHFQMYLELKAREENGSGQKKEGFWFIWSDTEKALRQLITFHMKTKYGPNWVKILEKKKPNLKDIFGRCKIAQEREERTFKDRASSNLLDFTYPQELFNIIFAEWKETFQPIFGKDKPYWSQRAALLARIRTPLAHNRSESLYEYELQIAEGYCNEILSIVENNILE